MSDQKISDSIRYHTNKISKIFDLKNNDKDDIRQTLALAALEAGRTYDPSRHVKKSTYIKAAVVYRAIDVMRNIERMPQVACCEESDNLEDTSSLYQRTQRDVHRESSTPDAPKLRKPVQLNCGNHIQNVVFAPETSDSDLKMDIMAVLDQLQPRQRTICQLLMKGLTNKDIANRLGIHKNTIQRQIIAIRKVFIKNNLGKF